MATDNDRPFDVGLQAERTSLSWQRTALALAVGCAVIIRFTAHYVGALAVVLGGIGIALAAATYVGARYRYRHAHRSLLRSSTLHELSTWPLAALTGSTFLLAVLGAIFVWGGSSQPFQN